MSSSNRASPFDAGDWNLFAQWAKHLRRALRLQWDRIEADPYRADVDIDVIQFAQAAAHLQSLLYRAAGLRKDEAICYRQDCATLYDRVHVAVPLLREFRNFLAHPPFIDDLVGDGHLMFIVASGVMRAPQLGGAASVIVDPWQCHELLDCVASEFIVIAETERERLSATEASDD